MDDPISETEARFAAIAATLPDNPFQASAEVLAFGALVSIKAGLSDDQAVSSLRRALNGLREQGVGEDRH